MGPATDKPKLDGLGIVVTRPAHQAGGLCRAIEAAGGSPLCFPVIEILPTLDPAPLNALGERLQQIDLLIFISTNAVTYGLAAIHRQRRLPDSLTIAAVGAATARALHDHGYAQTISPQEGFHSEALLAMPQLQQLAGKRVVIMRGDGGRELLATTLRQRGAIVEYIEAYRRSRPQTDDAPILEAWQRGEIQVITATSNEGLQNLFDMVSPAGHPSLLKTPLAVVSERMVKLAHQLGFDTCIVAKQASDQAIITAIEHWQHQEST